MPRLDIPAKMLGFADRSETWKAWLAELPVLASGLLADWELVVDAPSMHGECALVVPVRTSDDAPAVLKIGWPHEEAQHEHLALRLWGGNGTVRLLRADPHRAALLLERLEPVDLTTIDELEASEVIAGFYSRLHIPAPPRLRRLSTLCTDWSERLRALPMRAGLPRRYVEQAASLARDLAADPATDGRIIHTDLHHLNVLRGDREPWLVIDPKPLSGDPAFEVAPVLWNRWEEIQASGDARQAIRSRFFTVVDVAGLDEDRAKAWVVVRMIVNAMWEIEDASPASDEKAAWITDCVTISKSMAD